MTEQEAFKVIQFFEKKYKFEISLSEEQPTKQSCLRFIEQIKCRRDSEGDSETGLSPEYQNRCAAADALPLCEYQTLNVRCAETKPKCFKVISALTSGLRKIGASAAPEYQRLLPGR